MLWNHKRIDYQVYKEKKQPSFLIHYNIKDNRIWDSQDVFCSVGYNPSPSYGCFCHSSTSLDYLYDDCYPVSERFLKTKFPEWHKFFNDYLTEV